MNTEFCPSCRKPMDAGFLVTESLLDGAKWMKEKTRLALGGETLATADSWGNVYINAFRCLSCRKLTLTY